MGIVVVHAHMVAGMAPDASFLRESSSFYPHPRKIANVECPPDVAIIAVCDFFSFEPRY